MSHLLAEIGLRLAKVAAAVLLALVLYTILVAPFGNAGSVELVLLCWLSATAFILLVETSPI